MCSGSRTTGKTSRKNKCYTDRHGFRICENGLHFHKWRVARSLEVPTPAPDAHVPPPYFSRSSHDGAGTCTSSFEYRAGPPGTIIIGSGFTFAAPGSGFSTLISGMAHGRCTSGG